MPDQDQVRKPLLGIIFITLAFLGYAIMSGFVKACSLAALPSQEIMFFQVLVALLVLSPWFIKYAGQELVPKNKWLTAGRAIFGLLSFYLFFVAVKLVPLVNAVLLQNTTPFFIPLLGLILLRKKIALRVWATIAVGFIGVILVLNPGQGFLRMGNIIALAAGLCSAVTTIIVGRLENKGESAQTILLYFLAITILITGLWSIPVWKTPHGIFWIYLAGAGVLFAAFQILFMLALKFASAITIAPFIYLVVIFSGVVDWMVWHQIPHLMTVVGAVIVIASAILSTFPRARSSTS